MSEPTRSSYVACTYSFPTRAPDLISVVFERLIAYLRRCLWKNSKVGIINISNIYVDTLEYQLTAHALNWKATCWSVRPWPIREKFCCQAATPIRVLLRLPLVPQLCPRHSAAMVERGAHIVPILSFLYQQSFPCSRTTPWSVRFNVTNTRATEVPPFIHVCPRSSFFF